MEEYIFYLDESSAIDDFGLVSPPTYRTYSVLASGSYTLTLTEYDPPISLVLSDFVSGSDYCYSEYFNLPGQSTRYCFRMVNYDTWGYTDLQVVNESGSTVYLPQIRIISATPVVSDPVFSGLNVFVGSVIGGLIDYNTVNLATWLIAGLGVAAAPVICWYGYRWIRRKLKKSYFKGRL